MISNPQVLIAFPNYAGQGPDKYFLFDGQTLKATSSKKLSKANAHLITWEYEPVATALMAKQKRLPSKVLEIEELLVAASRNPRVKEVRKAFSVRKVLERYGCEQKYIDSFAHLNSASSEFCEETLIGVGKAILKAFRVLERALKVYGEYKRFVEIEVPVSHALLFDILKGVRFDRQKIAGYREDVEHEYYVALKNFSATYDMPLRTPTDAELMEVFKSNGFDLDNVSIDYLLEFGAKEEKFNTDAKQLRRLHTTMSALEGISHRKNLTYPTVVLQGTRTSRITLRSPYLQNLSKNYRDIFLASNGMTLSYVDYDQFEVGIMAALSGDKRLLKLYKTTDLYADLANDLFAENTAQHRKSAKILFLSYAYGMSRKNLRQAAQSKGAKADSAKAAFEQFEVFEKWKNEVEEKLRKERKVGTAFGNYYQIGAKGAPTGKQKRSAVSQVVQGTGSLIFKKALIKLHTLNEFRVLIPLHDAVLVEHSPASNIDLVVGAMEDAMTEQLDSAVDGKASVSEFG